MLALLATNVLTLRLLTQDSLARRMYLVAVHLLSDLPNTIKKSAKAVTAKLKEPTQMKVFCWPILVIQG